MAIREFTEQQRAAINAEGSLVVYAAAGSGKTAVLTERVKRLICGNNEYPERETIDADRILVVTFTEAAAAEMKGRIAEAINKEIEERELEGKLNSHLLRQQMLISASEICTIDAFCGRLVRENFEYIKNKEFSGISPDFAIVSKAKQTETEFAILNEMISERMEAKDESLKFISNAININSGLGELHESITKVYEKSQSLDNPEKWFADIKANYGDDGNSDFWISLIYDQVKSDFDVITATVDAYFNEIGSTGEDLTCTNILRDEIETFITAFGEYLSSGNWNKLKDLSEGLKMSSLPSVRKEKQPSYYPVRQHLKDYFVAAIKKISEYFKYTLEENIEILKKERETVIAFVDFVTEFGRRFKSSMVASDLMTFNMVEHAAFSLLCETDERGNFHQSEFAKSLSQKYDAVFVDEYQDNNNLQDAIFYNISNEGKNLFMVGDAKQCIYGFRNANPENFIRYRDEAHKKMRDMVVLDRNFRSRKGICDFVNFLFEATMSRKASNMEYTKDDQMIANDDYLKTDEPSVELHFVEYKKDIAKREAVAIHVVNYIKEMMAREPFLKGENNTLRRARYSDFAILLRSLKGKDKEYIAALKAAGIPVIYKSNELFDTVEVRIILPLLKAIDNPSDDVAMLSTITSSLFALTFDRIATLKSKYDSKTEKDTFYAILLRAKEAGEEDIIGVMETLTILRRKASTMSVAEFIQDVVDHFSIREMICSLKEPERRLQNIEKFISLAYSYESESRLGLSSFLRYIESCTSEDSKASFTSTEDAVKLMSIHASKGLEFPICILDCLNKFNFTDANNKLCYEEKYGIAMKVVDKKEHISYKPISKKIIEKEIKKNLIAEEQRILYVATTRAKEKLVMIFDGNKYSFDKIDKLKEGITDIEAHEGKLSPGSVLATEYPAEWIINSCLLHVDGEDLACIRRHGEKGTFKVVRSIHQKSEAVSESKAEITVDEKLVDELKKRFLYKDEYPYAKSVDSSTKTSVSKLLAEENGKEYRFTRRPAVCLKDQMNAAERGTAIHKFMQYANYYNAKTSLEDEITRLVEWEYMSEKEAESLDRTAITKFLSSELCDEIISSPMLLREQRFLVPLNDGEGETVIQGAVDCVWGNESGISILDFKTTKFDTEEDFRRVYSRQLEIYAYAMNEILESEVTNKYIYSLYLGKTIEV